MSHRPGTRLMALAMALVTLFVTELPALAADPLFDSDLARAAFVRTESGRRIMRGVVKDLPERLNRSHYLMFRTRLENRENRELQDKLKHHLTAIMRKVVERRNGAPAPTEAFEKQMELDFVVELAERELWDPGAVDLAMVADEPILESVSSTARASMMEAFMPQAKAAPAARRATRSRSAQPAPESAALEMPEPAPRPANHLPAEARSIDFYPDSPGMRRGVFARIRLTRDFLNLYSRDLIDLRFRDRNSPWTLRSAEGRAQDREFLYAIRRYVRLMGGYNDHIRDQFFIELLSNVSRPAIALLFEYARAPLRQYQQHEIGARTLVKALKDVAEEKKLDLPAVTWSAFERILYVIERMTFLAGGIEEGKVVPGEISEITRNLKRQQEGMASLEKNLASMEPRLAEARGARDAAGVRRIGRQIAAERAKIAHLRNQILLSIDLLAGFYAEVVQLKGRVGLFNDLRSGLMNRGLTTETHVGALDMHDVFVVPEDVNAIWKQYEDYGIGRMITAPDDPTYELPNISGRVIPLIVSDEMRVLRGRFLGESRKLAAELDALAQEACGCTVKQRKSMYELAEFIEQTSKRVLVVRGAVGVVTPVAGYVLKEPAMKFIGSCQVALEPVKNFFGY
ncbi:MAG TPA: hypothetical protein VM598_03580 [Bdellovibrionota bacterium]|nr:hypothetical protein [Bdellovibrionota bacterium]